MHNLAQHQKDRSLVSIFRDLIDGQSTEGYILTASDKLVVLQYVYDFHLDGIKVLRMADISDVECSDTNEFQKELLINEGLEQQVPFDAAIDAKDWASVLTQFSATYPILIVECEDSDENSFVIGRVLKIHADSVELLGFAGNGTWDEEAIALRFEDITSCQVGSNYLNVYQRYFAGRG
jgi:hypothetical protein